MAWGTQAASEQAGTSLPYLEKLDLAQQLPLPSKIPSAPWQLALGKGTRREVSTDGCSTKDSAMGDLFATRGKRCSLRPLEP